MPEAAAERTWATSKRPTFRDLVHAQGLPSDNREKAQRDRDQSLELARSSAFPWLLETLRSSRDNATVAEARSLRESQIGAAAYAAGVRDNSDGIIRFLLQHTLEKEVVGPVLEKRSSRFHRALRILMGKE